MSTTSGTGIGTLREAPLHASLKRWYGCPGDRFEVPVGRYVVDVVRRDLLIEIQTRGFSSLARKVAALLALGHRVRIVHPVAQDRWIVRVDEDGSVISRRRSPRHGQTSDVFAELVRIAGSLRHPALEVDVLLTEEEERRRHDPGLAWRRRGWTVVERRLIDVRGSTLLRGPGDLARLLPDGLPRGFTTGDLARAIGRPRRLAQQMAYSLRHAAVVEPVGKRGNELFYRRVRSAAAQRRPLRAAPYRVLSQRDLDSPPIPRHDALKPYRQVAGAWHPKLIDDGNPHHVNPIRNRHDGSRDSARPRAA